MGAVLSRHRVPDSAKPGKECHGNPLTLRPPKCETKNDDSSADLSETAPSAASQQTRGCPIHTRCFRHNPNRPNTAFRPPYGEESKSHYPFGEPQRECTCRPAPWADQHFARVASMPRFEPLPGYEYLSILDRCAPPVRFCTCSSCDKISPSRRYSRDRASYNHTFQAEQGKNLVVGRKRGKFYGGDGREHTGNIVYGLARGDVELPVNGRDDWTTDWTWALAVRYRDPARHWRIDGRFYFNWMPDRLQQGVPWTDRGKTRLHEGDELEACLGPTWMVDHWKSVRTFSDTAMPPRWCAVITMLHESSDTLAVTSPRDYFTPQAAERAQMVLRTGPGLFKRVMWYHRGLGYGNDVEEREPGPWDDGAMREYSSFVQPLIGR